MNKDFSKYLHLFLFLLAVSGLAIFYYSRIFGNLCIDSDTLNYVMDLDGKKDTLTFFKTFGVTGWFSKFHLLFFPLVYLVTGAYSLWNGWDFLMGFKIISYLSALGTFGLLYYICRKLINNFWIGLVISLIPFLTFGPCWLITTCDDNVIATLCDLLFIMALLFFAGALGGDWARHHTYKAAWLIGVSVSLGLAIHMKSIVTSPLILTPLFLKDFSRKTRLKAMAHIILSIVLCMGSLYCIYWYQSSAEPIGSKTDFWVFHRVPGRFFFIQGSQPFSVQVDFVYQGIKSSLYAEVELFLLNIMDHDILGHVVIGSFFLLYLIALFKTRTQRASRILFFFFLLHFLHSSVYDSWVYERWDSILIPMFLTIGMCSDELLLNHIRRCYPLLKRAYLAGAIAVFSVLVWANINNTRLLIDVTTGHLQAEKSSKKWRWPPFCFMLFSHKDIYNLAVNLDHYFDAKTYVLPLSLSQPRAPDIIDKYFRLYSKNYRMRQLKSPQQIMGLASSGQMDKLLFIGAVHIPFVYVSDESFIRIDPRSVKVVYKNDQLVLKEADFVRKGNPIPD
ncbi:MAG: hypothetical protein NTX71_08910 [Candidatus Aureabacteria bacterium]|nr:hypothetical protein [Candidatus Auribacterota bacterium]